MHFSWELQLVTQYIYLVYTLRSNCNKDAYMHEQTTKGFGKMNIWITRFGIHIGHRKYLNEYKPFRSVSLWAGTYQWPKSICFHNHASFQLSGSDNNYGKTEEKSFLWVIWDRPSGPVHTWLAIYPIVEKGHIDILGPLKLPNDGDAYVLSMVDQFTRWHKCIAMPHQKAGKRLDCAHPLVLNNGAPISWAGIMSVYT